MDALLLGFFVHEQHLRRHWHDFVVEFAGCLSGCRALLAAERVFVLNITRDVVAASDDFSCLQHRHIGVLRPRDDVGIDCAIAVAMLILDEADRLEAAANHNRHAVDDDLLGCCGDSHHARGALTIHAHARHA